MRFSTVVLSLFIVANLYAQNNDSIQAIAPTGAFVLSSDIDLVFEWNTNFSYNGNFRLKIRQLNPGDKLPQELPDNDLFYFQEDINSNQFSYPEEAPSLVVNARYAWQVETVNFVNGRRIRGPVIGIEPVSGGMLSCNVGYSGVPEGTLCPGDCFSIQATLPLPLSLFSQHQFTLFVDYPDMPPGAVIMNGMDAYDQSLLCEPIQSPQVSSANASTIDLTICINESVQSPLEFSLYYNRSGSFCESDPCGMNCCHNVFSFLVEVADLTNFADIALEIKDPLGINTIQEMCSGDQALFSLLNLPTTANTTLNWQFSDNEGIEWQNINVTPFLAGEGMQPSYTFLVPPDNEVLTINCANSTNGYIDRLFRAQILTFNETDTCEYFTPDYPLRICCPLSPNIIDISTEEDFDLQVGLCEVDTLSIDIELQSSDPFVITPGDEVDIQWWVNNELRSDLAGQIAWDTLIIVGTEDICIEVEVSNCSGKTQKTTRCINVDPKPVCGTISLQDPSITGMIQDGILIYKVCPGYAGSLLAEGFDQETCTIQWEFSYDLDGPWFPMGNTNTIQNTNIVVEGNNPIIYYRVQCNPLNEPSGCEPCMSDTIAIMEDLQMPADPFIDCTIFQFCEGTEVEPYVTNVEQNTIYTWFVNGVEYGSGEILTFNLTESTCFQYSATNNCYTLTSEPCCVEACKLTPLISCPLFPNECACLGEAIFLTAEYSQSSCGHELSFEWSWTDADGNLQTSTEVEISDTPPATGTTYTLTVTDVELGCSDETSLTIIPCDKP